MNGVSLLHTSRNPAIDEPLAYTVGLYEATFPDRVRGYYLPGSYADGCAVVGSDLDTYVLFKEAFLSPDEAVRAQQIADICAGMSTLRLEIKLGSEQSLADEHSIVRVALKRSSILLYGKDTRAAMALPTREAYTRDATEGVLEFLFRLHRLDVIPYPLDYPDPDGMFYGYDHLTRLPEAVVAIQHPERTAATYYATRELVECACRMATALLALRKTDSFVGTKRGSVEVYRDKINDAWSPFLLAMFEKGKMQWEYGLPEREEERMELRRLCAEMLAFENYYLLHYRCYLHALLHGNDEQASSFATQRLQMVHYEDENHPAGQG